MDAGDKALVFRFSSSAGDHLVLKIVADQASAWYSSYSWRHVDDSANGELHTGRGAVPGSRTKT